MIEQPVVIAGGGLAGLAAAVRLAQSGIPVRLIEARNRLGGRAGSFADPQTGEPLDNCQHVLMGCCTNLLDFYKRIGVTEAIEWHDTLHFADECGRRDVMEADELPAPLHLLASVALFKSFSLSEKLRIALGFHHILRLHDDHLPSLHGMSIEAWLLQQGQTRPIIDKFWAAVIVSALNEIPSRCAADYALRVFRDGFLRHPDAYRVGLARCALSELYDPARSVIEQAGGTLSLSTRVETIEADADRGFSFVTSQGVIRSKYAIAALPYDRTLKAVTGELLSLLPSLQCAASLESSPIVGIHLWFDRPVMEVPLTAFFNSPIHWVFRKQGGHVHAVVSAATSLVSMTADEIAAMAAREIAARFPTAQTARLLRHRVVKEKRATFSVRPGSDDARPHAVTPVGNFFLAGDWCRTGWPATMEGAVRSGYLAAHACLLAMGNPHGEQALAADLPVCLLPRLLACV